MKCSSGKQSSFHDYRYDMNNFISPAFVSLERPSTCFEIAHTTDEVLATLLTQIAICNIAPSTRKNKNKNKKLLVLQSQATQNSKSPISYTHRQPNSQFELIFYIYTSIDTNHHVIPVTKSQLLAKKLQLNFAVYQNIYSCQINQISWKSTYCSLIGYRHHASCNKHQGHHKASLLGIHCIEAHSTCHISKMEALPFT